MRFTIVLGWNAIIDMEPKFPGYGASKVVLMIKENGKLMSRFKRMRRTVEMLAKKMIFFGAFLVTAICAYGQEVHYNYDRGADFTAYKTYQWVEISDRVVPDQLVDHAIKQAIEEQLSRKGLTKVSTKADLYIAYQVVVNLEKSVDLLGTGDGPGWWGGGWGNGTVRGRTSTVPVGILLVDLYDVGKRQLVWRGDVVKAIDLKKDPEKNYRNLQRVVTKLFKNYPPKSGR